MAVDTIPAQLSEAFGFRNGNRGVHSSRSMMLGELELVLGAASASWDATEYRTQLDSENLLGKRTATNRAHSARKLRALYGLDPEITVFRLLQHFWELDDDGATRPILALLCATARDPLLRSLTPILTSTEVGEVLDNELLRSEVETVAGDRFSESTKRSAALNVATSWRQSGHLAPRTRMRRKAPSSPAVTTYALALGYLEGRRGAFLLDSLWTQLLDLNTEELRQSIQSAALNGWLVYRAAGDVVEVRFPGLWTETEKELLDE